MLGYLASSVPRGARVAYETAQECRLRPRVLSADSGRGSGVLEVRSRETRTLNPKEVAIWFPRTLSDEHTHNVRIHCPVSGRHASPPVVYGRAYPTKNAPPRIRTYHVTASLNSTSAGHIHHPTGPGVIPNTRMQANTANMHNLSHRDPKRAYRQSVFSQSPYGAAGHGE